MSPPSYQHMHTMCIYNERQYVGYFAQKIRMNRATLRILKQKMLHIKYQPHLSNMNEFSVSRHNHYHSKLCMLKTRIHFKICTITITKMNLTCVNHFALYDLSGYKKYTCLELNYILHKCIYRRNDTCLGTFMVEPIVIFIRYCNTS